MHVNNYSSIINYSSTIDHNLTFIIHIKECLHISLFIHLRLAQIYIPKYCLPIVHFIYFFEVQIVYDIPYLHQLQIIHSQCIAES